MTQTPTIWSDEQIEAAAKAIWPSFGALGIEIETRRIMLKALTAAASIPASRGVALEIECPRCELSFPVDQISDHIEKHIEYAVSLASPAPQPVQEQEPEDADTQNLTRAQLLDRLRVHGLNAALYAEETDEAYEIGKRDGYNEAVQDIDQLTGGDGEYRVSLDLENGGVDEDRHTPDAASMKRRIVARAEAAEAKVERLTEALRGCRCPRPANSRPDDFTIGQCVAAGECGCSDGAPLSEFRHDQWA